jgi:hypothetical protein
MPGVRRLPSPTIMGYYVTKLRRPYDYKVLVDAYVYTQRTDFVHGDFGAYYKGLVAALEAQFGVHLRQPEGSVGQSALWMLFRATVGSPLRIGTPWDQFLEATLIVSTLKQTGEVGKAVFAASDEISRAVRVSEAAHRDILYNLFRAMYGDHPETISSDDLARAGFYDSKEPDIADYYDYF